MAALIVVVVVALSVAHWLMSPLCAALTPLVQLQPLPWLGLGVMLWLLAAQRGPQE